jgi:hypothetical protein
MCRRVVGDEQEPVPREDRLERVGKRTEGGIENAIGRMRRHLPRKTALATLSPHLLDACVQRDNNTPRKCLGFLTPHEALAYASSSVALQTGMPLPACAGMTRTR